MLNGHSILLSSILAVILPHQDALAFWHMLFAKHDLKSNVYAGLVSWPCFLVGNALSICNQACIHVEVLGVYQLTWGFMTGVTLL